MTEQEARKLATETAEKLFTDGQGNRYQHLSLDNKPNLGWGDGPMRDIIQGSILTACREDAEAIAAAERERCAQYVQSLYGIAGLELANKLRALSPANALEEHDRKVKMEEAEWWHRAWQGCESDRHKCDPDNSICQRLAALRGKK